MRVLGVVVAVLALLVFSGASLTAGQIADIKAYASDGDTVNLCGVVTAYLYDCWYIQDLDCPVGMKLKRLAAPTARGVPRPADSCPPVDDHAVYLSLVGTSRGVGAALVCTDENGERYLRELPSTATSVSIVRMPAALNLTNRLLGGCCFRCADGVSVGQIGVHKGCGENTVGVLVQTSGMVLGHDSRIRCFYIDDGTMPFDGSGRRRIRVSYADLIPPYWVPPKYARVNVRGICTIYQDTFGLTRPMVRLREPGDVRRIP